MSAGGDGSEAVAQHRLGRLLWAGAALLALGLAVLLGSQVLALTGIWIAPPLRLGLSLVGFMLSAGAMVWLYRLLQDHLYQLERLRGAVVILTGGEDGLLPPRLAEDGSLEIARLHAAISDLAARFSGERAAPDLRLQAVLAAISEAIVVVTESGQVSLVNHPAKQLLGAEAVKVGTSLFAALHRHPVIDAIGRAEQAGQPIRAVLQSLAGEDLDVQVASLGVHGGAVLVFPTAEVEEHTAEVEHDLTLHDRPPAAGAIGEATPIAELPMLVLDSETTGLDVRNDRVISVGAIRLHGARVYRSASMDRLVHPGMRIPPRSTAVHGITDAMIVDAPSFPHVYPEIHDMLQGCVLVGHNIAFDQAMLRRECTLAGLAWPDPYTLDTLLLAAAIDPELADLRLEGLAEYFGVDIHGRHTALGDALVTAEILVRMLPRLSDIGVATLGDALTLSSRPKALVKAQQQAGW